MADEGIHAADEGDALYYAGDAAAAAVPDVALGRGSARTAAVDDLVGAPPHSGTTLLPSPSPTGRGNQVGWEWRLRIVDPRIGRWTRCRSSGRRSTTPCFEDHASELRARRRCATGAHPWRSCSSTEVTGRVRPRDDYEGWTPPCRGWRARLAIHDVFPDPADGGRPPYEQIFVPALESGRFQLESATGSLRVLRRVD